jgi:hypothetical protein
MAAALAPGDAAGFGFLAANGKFKGVRVFYNYPKVGSGIAIELRWIWAFFWEKRGAMHLHKAVASLQTHWTFVHNQIFPHITDIPVITTLPVQTSSRARKSRGDQANATSHYKAQCSMLMSMFYWGCSKGKWGREANNRLCCARTLILFVDATMEHVSRGVEHLEFQCQLMENGGTIPVSCRKGLLDLRHWSHTLQHHREVIMLQTWWNQQRFQADVPLATSDLILSSLGSFIGGILYSGSEDISPDLYHMACRLIAQFTYYANLYLPSRLNQKPSFQVNQLWESGKGRIPRCRDSTDDKLMHALGNKAMQGKKVQTKEYAVSWPDNMFNSGFENMSN